MKSLEARFNHDPMYHQQYSDVIQTYVATGFIQIVPSPAIEGYYMPHFGVVKESATTPLRVVFNASSKHSSGQSLNEYLRAGPNSVEMLFDLMLRFRSKPYAVTTDISKVFRHVILNPKDAKYARFPWPENSSKITTFEFKVVIFGVTLSPYNLQQVLQAHLQKKGRGKLIKYFHVDNFIKTYDSVEK